MGLSAGAVGASILAAKLEAKLSGLILLFGAHPDIEKVTLPTLMIFGNRDERFPAEVLRSISSGRGRVSPSGFSAIEISGTHFELVHNPRSTQEVIRGWMLKNSSL